MQTHNNISLYPGLLCDSVEFFRFGKQLKFMTSGAVKPFYELSSMHYQLLREQAHADKDAWEVLMIMHPDSEMKRIEKYTSCNFSGLDYTPDIERGELQKGEYWDCPERGSCIGEGKICKPLTFNGQVISKLEIEIIKLSVTDKKNEAIAQELLLPLGTFHLIKKKLHEKLGVASKQQLVLIAIALNIISL
jgi:DNA-binding CsgD family transcriptional regulator